MIRLLWSFFYLCGYLLLSIPSLRKAQKIAATTTDVSTSDYLVHETPKKWAKSFVKTTGSSVKVLKHAGIPEGPVVLVSNHEGDFDIPVLIGYVDKPFGLMSKIEVKKIPLVRSWMEVMSCLFIDRKNRRQAVTVLRQGATMLKDGHSLLIFPEGTRSLGKGIGEFKSGSVRIAKDASVPIVPVVIHGTAAIFEQQKPAIKPAHVVLSVLPAISAEVVASSDQKELNELLQQVMKAEWERIKTEEI